MTIPIGVSWIGPRGGQRSRWFGLTWCELSPKADVIVTSGAGDLLFRAPPSPGSSR
jgi:hypothetical protein